MEVAVKQERMCVYIHTYVCIYIVCIDKKCKDSGKGRKQKGKTIKCSPRTTALMTFAASLCCHSHGRGQSKGSGCSCPLSHTSWLQAVGLTFRQMKQGLQTAGGMCFSCVVKWSLVPHSHGLVFQDWERFMRLNLFIFPERVLY